MTEEIDYVTRYEDFLKSYKTEDGETPYNDAIARLSLDKDISVSIDFNQLLTFDPELAAATKENPQRAIEAASAAIRRILRIVDSDYSDTIENLHARFKEVPNRVSVRFIRAEHIGQFIMVDALVTRVSDVKPLLVEGVFQCRQCQEIIYVQQANQFTPPSLCTNEACRSKSPFDLIPERSKFVDWQKIRLQEKPEELPPGALPRALDCILQDDLVDIARPGDPCRVVGILRSTQDRTARTRRKAPTFSTFLATNYVEVSEREADRVEIDPKEEEQIRELAQDPLIHRKLVNSIAPSIYGLTDIKEAVCLLLFGGVSKVLADGVKIRGDSNILLVGDPGTAKSIHGSEKIYIGLQEKNRIHWTTESIGSFVDKLMVELADEIIERNQTEILTLHDTYSIFTQSMDPFSLKIRKAQIYEVSRHQTNTLVKIHTRSGRTVLATPDHSFTTISNGHLKVITAKELHTGIYLPVARKMSLETGTSTIDLSLNFSTDELVGTDIIPSQIEPVRIEANSARKAAALADLTPNTMGSLIHCSTSLPAGSWARRKYDTSWVPKSIRLGTHAGRSMGYYLAEGNSEGTTIKFSNIDKLITSTVEEDLVSTFGKVSPFEKGVFICQSSLAKWFQEKFGSGAEEKYIPTKLLTTPYSFRCAIISGFFSINGTIDTKGSAISATTIHQNLAYQLSDLLATLGIFATIKERTVTRGPYQDRIYYQIQLQSEEVIQFRKQIKLVSNSKQRALDALVANLNTRRRYPSRDVIPNFGRLLYDASKELGIQNRKRPWARVFFGELRRKTQRQRVGRKYLQKALSKLSTFKSTQIHSPTLSWLHTLAHSQIFWDPITAIEQINQPTTVYDIGTSDGHFVLAQGNLVVHNSQLLKYVAQIAPRGLYTSGKGSTAAGLCVGAESKIALSSGVDSISNVVERQFKGQTPIEYDVGIRYIKNRQSDLRVFHSKNLHLELGSIDKFWKITSPELMIRIRSKTGKTLELTPRTSVLSLEESGSLVWKPASQLRKGDRVATTNCLTQPTQTNQTPYRHSDPLNSLTQPEIHWDTLTDVTKSPPTHPHVYDLTIPGTHNFVVNDFIVHNTAAVLRDPDTEGFALEAGALVLADRGTACLAGNSRIVFDNKYVPIQQVFDQVDSFKAVSNNEIMEISEVNGLCCSLLSSNKTTNGIITRIRRKTHEGDLLRIKLFSGFELKVTPNHLLLEGNTLQWKAAEDYEVGNYLIAPMKLPSNNELLYILDIVSENWFLILSPSHENELIDIIANKLHSFKGDRRLHGLLQSLKSRAKRVKVSEFRYALKKLRLYDDWKTRLFTYGKARPTETLKTASISPEMAYYFGFVFGNGCVQKPKTPILQIGQSSINKDQILMIERVFNRFSNGHLSKVKQTTDSTIRGKKTKRDIIHFNYRSRLCAELYNFLTRDYLENLLLLDDESLKAFIAGILDSDGCISIRKCRKNGKDYQTVLVDFQISSKLEENRAFALALRRFGCYSRIREGKDNIHVEMTGRSDIKRLIALVQNYSVKVKNIPERRHSVSSESEKLPGNHVSELSKKIISKSNTSELVKNGTWSTLDNYRKEAYQPSRKQVLKIIERNKSVITKEIKQELDRILSQDYFLDKIVEIQRIPFNGKVYDPYVPGPHNFTASGIFLRNCIDEFDKMRPQDRTAIHETMEQHSYHPSTEVLLPTGERVEIGSFVDELFEQNRGCVIQGVNCEILDGVEQEIELFSLLDNSVCSVPVDRISRHPAPDVFYRITYSNGRSVIVTPEHPVFVFEGGKITTISSSELQPGRFVPAPRRLPCGHNPGALLSTDFSSPFNVKAIKLPDRVTWELSRILGYFVSEGYSYDKASGELGFSNTNPDIMNDIIELMRTQFDLEEIDYVRRNRTVRFVSSRLRDFFKTNFPKLMELARQKRAPQQVFVSGENAVKHFLQAAFLGDGRLESERLCYRTSSQGLACDYQDLLLCLQIQSRVLLDSSNDSYIVNIHSTSLPRFFDNIVEEWDPRRTRIKKLVERSKKSNYNHDVFPPEYGIQVKELLQRVGVPYRGTFYRPIRENHGITRKRLTKYLKEIRKAFQQARKTANTPITSIRDARNILRWSQETAAKKIARSRSFVDYMERGGYSEDLRQITLTNLMTLINAELDEIEVRLERLVSLFSSDMRYLRVKAIERLENTGEWACPYVYDLTIEPTHSFISNGLLLHNTVSIAKAGIVATLNARTAILAAANPNLGRYVPERSFAENVNLPVTLLSRFDLIFTLTDLPEAERDERTADHIISLHQQKGKEKDPPIPADLLRKYIAYARRGITPKLTDDALNVIKDFYLGMRKSGERENAPVPITARQLESLIRLTEAHAKMALRETVLAEDAQAAVRLVQVSLQQVGFDAETGQFDIDNIMIGRAKSQRDKLRAILTMIRELEKETPEGVPIEKLEERAELDGISTTFVRQAVVQLRDKDGLIFEPRPGRLKYIKGA